MTTPEHPAGQDPPERAGAPTDRQPSCLMLHGLGGGPYELRPLIDALEAEGLRLSVPVLPGHEGPGPVMPPSQWRDWAATAETAFDELAAAGGPVVVIGFSTGVPLALHLAGARPVARQVLLSPFLAIRYSGLVPWRPSAYLRRLAAVMPDLPRRPPAVRDGKMRRWASGASRFRTFNVHAALSALELIDEIKQRVPEITIPTLIIRGERDTVVEPSGASWLYRHLGAAQKVLVSLPRSDHLVALDREREQVIAVTRDFVLGQGDGARGSTTG
jgi:carboxylesterase